MRKFSVSRAMEGAVVLSKFRGSMLGALLGDCCGEPFEGQDMGVGDKAVLRRNFDQLEGPFFKAPVKKYTDDSTMTKSVARCLIEHKDIVSKELAKSFVQDYFKEPGRGYGGGVVEVFQKLRRNKLSDPLGPALEQFNGTGSYGNGAAMRVAPVGLFCHNKPAEKLLELVRKSAEITHTHRLGVNGAIVQALAVNLCLQTHSKAFTPTAFLDQLIPKVHEIESIPDELGFKDSGPTFEQQLKQVQRFLLPETHVSQEEILNILGHDASAIYSVPTAIFSFVKGQAPIEGIHTENPFRRTLEYAISLGGDTDTIASMAGSLAGALHGDSIIAPNIIKHCEGHEEFIELANKLYEASA